MAERMRLRASTDLGPVRVSVGGAPQRAQRPAKRRALATGLRLPKKADLPPPVAPAGWYPDPEDATRMRWWNGVKWTRRFAEPGAAKPVTRTADAPPKVRPKAQRPRKKRLGKPAFLEASKPNPASERRGTQNPRRT